MDWAQLSCFFLAMPLDVSLAETQSIIGVDGLET
jgi:hypothetical protein